jgi:ribose 5-phosphate isomerase RpiB
LTLGAWQGSDETQVLAIVESFLATEFEGGRHARRVEKIRAYEEKG